MFSSTMRVRRSRLLAFGSGGDALSKLKSKLKTRSALLSDVWKTELTLARSKTFR
jgi:hypothetical protein